MKVQWPGRLEIVEGPPDIVLDSAHNASKMSALVGFLRDHCPRRRLLMVIGASSDKDIRGMVETTRGVVDLALVTRSTNPRNVQPQVMAEILGQNGVPYEVIPSVPNALARAKELAGEGDLICVTGSMFVVMEARVVLGLTKHHEQSW